MTVTIAKWTLQEYHRLIEADEPQTSEVLTKNQAS
jgi:hypothetical protein